MNRSLEFAKEREADLQRLLAATGTKTLKDLVNNALTILEWAVDEAVADNEIAAVNEQREVYRVLLIPILQRTAEIAKGMAA